MAENNLVCVCGCCHKNTCLCYVAEIGELGALWHHLQGVAPTSDKVPSSGWQVLELLHFANS
jgi:hypothetical protein